MKSLCLVIFAAILIAAQMVAADTTTTTTNTTTKRTAKRVVRVKKVEEAVPDAERHSKTLGPWDFSGTIGLDNPGTEIEFLAAYRVTDYVLEDLDDSLSIETGLGFLSVSDTFAGTSYSYSAIAIPIMARWDIHIRDSKFTVSPRAGFTYLTGGTATVNGVSVTTRGGNLYFQLGGVGFLQLNNNFALRAGVAIGGFTSLNFGVTYFL